MRVIRSALIWLFDNQVAYTAVVIAGTLAVSGWVS